MQFDFPGPPRTDRILSEKFWPLPIKKSQKKVLVGDAGVAHRIVIASRLHRRRLPSNTLGEGGGIFSQFKNELLLWIFEVVANSFIDDNFERRVDGTCPQLRCQGNLLADRVQPRRAQDGLSIRLSMANCDE